MRVAPCTASLHLVSAAALRRAAEPLVEPIARLPDRYPQYRPAAPGPARVVEGEVLPRAAPDTWLDADRARVLLGQAERAAPPARAADTAGLLPATVAFYELHGSAENLFADPAGGRIDQYV
jgi:hypothetical protein